MYDLNTRAAPWRERRRLLATTVLAEQRLPAAIQRDLTLLRSGACAWGDLSVRRGLLRALRGMLGEVLIYAVAGRLALMAAVYAASRMFAEAGAWQQALGISLAYVMFQLIGGYLQAQSDYARGKCGHGAGLYLTTRINAKVLRLPAELPPSFTAGQLKNLISSDVKYLAEFIASIVWNLVPAVASLLILGPMIYLLAGMPGLIGIITSFIYVPGVVLFSGRMQQATADQQRRLDQVATTAGEWLRNVRLSRYLGWQAAFEADIALQVRSMVKALIKRHLIACLTFGISFTWWMVPVIGMLVSARMMGQDLDLVGFFSTLWVIKDLNDYLQHVPHTFNIRASAMACLDRIEALEACPDLTERLSSSGIGIASGAYPVSLELVRISFAYDGREPLFDELSLTLDLCQRTAVVGVVGGGKTTLLRIIAGDLPPSRGEILVVFSNGQRAPLWDQAVYLRYRDHIAYVPQEPFIANDTLVGNITLAAAAADEQASRAVAMAELTADLALFAAGLATPIGEAGVNLSGGQRQRVNLSRAFYAQRRLLLLDDPLSAVDGPTEARLMTNIVATSCPFILVTHRLAELQAVDRVLVMGGGRILEDGWAQVLLNDPASLYAQLGQLGELAPPAPPLGSEGGLAIGNPHA